MKTKRIIAALLSIMMLMSFVPGYAAYDFTSNEALTVLKSGTTEENMPTLTLVCIESDGASTPMPKKDGDGNYVLISDVTTLPGGSSFFVGLRADNFTQFLHNDECMYMWGTGVAFNPTYVEWEPTNSRGAATNFQKRIHDEYKFEFTQYQTYALDSYVQKDTEANADVPEGCTKTAAMLVRYNVDEDTYMYEMPESEYIAFLEFKVKEGDANTEVGKQVLALSKSDTDTCLQFGSSGDYSYTYNNDSSKLQNYLKLDTESVNFFPGAVNIRTLQSIAVKGGTYAIPAQYEGKALDVTGLTIEGTYNLDPTTADIPASEVSYFYGATGITDATDAGLTAVPATLTADQNGKSLYAVAGGKIVEVGTLSVSAVVIDEVTGVTGVPSGVYEDDTINMSGISATVNKNDGTDGVNIPYADFGTNGLAVYKVADADGSKTYTEVTSTDKYALGDNVFVVAKSGGITSDAEPYEEFTVNAAYDNTTLSSSENNAPKVKYAVGNKFDPTGIKVNTKKDTEATATEVAYSGFAEAGLKVVIAADPEAALTADEATADTEITADMIGKKIYVVVDNNGTKSVLEVGTISDRGIESATASGITADAKTYGDTLGDGVSLTVKYDNNDADETIAYADFGTKNVTMKIGDATVDKDTVLTPDMSGKTVDFYVNGVKVASSVALTVNKKAVDVDVSYLNLETPAVQKEYDGTVAIPADRKSNVMPKIDTNDLLDADKSTYADLYIDQNSVTIEYASKNVGTNTLNYSGTPAVAYVGPNANILTDFAKYYTLNGFTAANNTLTHSNVAITAKTLNVTAITGVPTVEVGAETLIGSGTLALATANSNIVEGENVTLTYDYAYANADAAGEVDVTISNGAISGADAANYTLGTVPATAKGEVTNKKLASVTVVAPTKVEYTYPDTKLDLTGMQINLNYEGASAPTTMDVADFIADGGIISLTDATGQAVTVTADNMTDTITLPYGETTISIAYGGKEATQKVTAAKKKVSLADITFDASKVYGNDTVTGTYTVAEGVIEAGDAVTVEATYTFTEDPETAGENKEVKITGIALTGDAAANYELDGTETTINTGIVSQGSQVAPAVPTVTVDPKTNNLVITGPIGENIEYSIDGGKTWVTNTTFTGIGNGKTVTVQARVKATADGNLAASDASTTEAKTLKYHVVVYQAKTSTEKIVKEVYTDDISKPTKDSEVNTMIFDNKPSGFKAYFSDSEAKVAQTYPLKADGAGEVVLYMTKSTGGGGGVGSQTYKVTFSAGTNGEITDGKAIANVTSKVTAVPTVTAKEGYTFVGWSQDGTTVVDPLTVKITKATTFTALYESTVEETPAPTVAPTEEPVDNEPIIDVNYTAPYASGYEDGSFRPENNITRAELAAMIARLSYGGDLPDGMYDSSFPDVADDAWYNKYVAYLEDKNVLSGYEDGTFRPENTITRGEISAVIARAQRYEILPYSGMFADVTDYDWAKDYIETLAVKNIVTGYEDGTFGPYSPLTRAEAVAIINRVLAPSTPVVTFTPNDIAGHWAEADIILAVNERIVNGTEVVEPVEPEETEDPAEEVTEEVADETVEDTEATEEVTENTEDAADVAPEGVEGTEITTETEETTEVPAE